MANLAKVSKAIAGGISGFAISFSATTPSSKLEWWSQFLIAIGAGIVGYNAVYWAPKNSG